MGVVRRKDEITESCVGYVRCCTKCTLWCVQTLQLHMTLLCTRCCTKHTLWCVQLCSCAANPVYKTRLVAAQALRPLLSTGNVLSVLSRLLDQLPSPSSSSSSLSLSSSTVVCHNVLHGLLLQVGH